MSNSSFRINTKVGNEDQVVKVNLKQGIKTINILSLEINPEDAYNIQTSEYGVVVGRVLANKEFGIPNVKVSVFIPIEEADENDYIISNEYPYKTPQSKNNDGVKYNLVKQGKDSPGTFPNKNFVLDNNSAIEVFDKYWKYTTTTNESGDYMIFGVPTGTCQVHYDCDLSDIGILSQHPYDLIEKGYDANLFKYRTKFSEDDLSSAVHIISQDSTVYVYPFWGDKGANKIGITRKDFDVNYEFTPSCIFMGSSITDTKGAYIGVDGKPNGTSGRFNTLETSSGNIEIIRYTPDGSIEEVKENVAGVIDGNGVWCYQIPMNLDRIGTDEYGNLKVVNDPTRGIPTRARVRFRISLTDAQSTEASEYTAKMLVPCNPRLIFKETELSVKEPIVEGFKQDDPYNEPSDWKNMYEFGSNTPDSCFRDLYWGKVYSVKQYYPRFQYEYVPRILSTGVGTSVDFLSYDYTGYPPDYLFNASCISSIDQISGLNIFPYTTLYSSCESISLDNVNPLLTNSAQKKRIGYWFYEHLNGEVDNESLSDKGLHFCFENDWINGCLYFPRVIIKKFPNNNYDYFGSRNDVGGYDATYDYTEISGRHCWIYNSTNKNFQLSTLTVNLFEICNSENLPDLHDSTRFSRCNLKTGIIKQVKTNVGDTVFYYRCGCIQHEDLSSSYAKGYVYRRLYSTDLILLGNIEDIFDNLPKLYKSLPSTTAIFPPLAPPDSLSESGMCNIAIRRQLNTLYQFCGGVDIYLNIDYNFETDQLMGYSDYDSSAALYKVTSDYILKQKFPSNKNRYNLLISALQDRYTLFFCVYYNGVNKGEEVIRQPQWVTYYYPTSFVNISRICELDVHNDSSVKFNVSGNSFVYPNNGIIDYLDISTNENRSSFASMNYEPDKHILDKIGYKHYAMTPLNLVGFEGRLSEWSSSKYYNGNVEISDSLSGVINLAVDFVDYSYVNFRFNGNSQNKDVWNGPFIQSQKKFKVDNDNIDISNERMNGLLYLPENSFYFYFGLRSGLSALDMLREKYVGDEDSENLVSQTIVVSQNRSKIGCINGLEVGVANVNTSGLTLPLYYSLYYKNIPYSSGVSNDSSWEISNLPTGVYKIEMTDSLGNVFNKNFSILSSGVSFECDTYIDDNNGERVLIINKINSESVLSAYSGESANELRLITSQLLVSIIFSVIPTEYSISNGLIVKFENTITSVDVTSVLLRTNETFSGITSSNVEFNGTLNTDNTISGITSTNVIFGGVAESNSFSGITSTNIGFSGTTNSDYTFDGVVGDTTFSGKTDTQSLSCIKSFQTIIFTPSPDTKLFLNNIPVEYIKNWSEYNTNTMDVINPDNIFSGCTFNLWDSLKTPFVDDDENCFNFKESNLSYATQLSYLSSMFNCVFGGGAMSLTRDVQTPNYTELLINPIYDGFDNYNYPYLYWDEPITSDVIQEIQVSGYLENNINIPHIVGSNYPRSADTRTFLLTSATEKEYTNNRTIKHENMGIPSDNFGINLFGSKHYKYTDLDKPGPLRVNNSTDIASSGTTSGLYSLSGITNFYGIRTVDKRFDYEFTLKTPLLLPSLGNSFSAVTRTIINGGAEIDLYGGIRLDYDNNLLVTSYGFNSQKGVISGCPTPDAELYSEKYYEDDSIDRVPDDIIRNNIWHNKRMDIDSVHYSFQNLSGTTSLTTEFVGCNSNFSGGYVNPGATEMLSFSYESGVSVIKQNSEDYDVLYEINDKPSGFTEYFASLSGSNLTFTVLGDDRWNGYVYTDINTQNSENGKFPSWAQKYEDKLPYASDIHKELLIYGCEPSSADSKFNVASGYTVNFKTVHSDLPEDPRYDSEKYISAFYQEGGNDYVLSDDVCKQYVRFKINNPSRTEMSRSSFLMIPTRKVYIGNGHGTLLKQGVVYNMGYAYYASSLKVKIDTTIKTAIIRLYTPLRINPNEPNWDSEVNYSATYLTTSDGWHTIGNIINYTCEQGELTYTRSRAEFNLQIMGDYNYGDIYFDMENGLRYKIHINF